MSVEHESQSKTTRDLAQLRNSFLETVIESAEQIVKGKRFPIDPSRVLYDPSLGSPHKR